MKTSACPTSSAARPDQIRVEPDPERLSLYGITLAQLVGKVQEANRAFLAGRVRETQPRISVAAGQTLQGIPDIGLLLLSARDGRPVYVRDVANVVVGAKPLEHQAWHFTQVQRTAASNALPPSRSLLPSAPAPMPSSFPSASCTASPS